MEPIAEWHLHASKHGAARVPVCLTVYRPQPHPKSVHGDYQTFVEINGISINGIPKSRQASGVSSLQSMVLAIKLLQLFVECALSDGWLFFEDTGDPFDVLASLGKNAG